MKIINNQLPEIQVSFNRDHWSDNKYIIKDSQSAYNVLLELFNPETLDLYEEFIVLFLDRKNGIIGYRVLSRGGAAGTVVDVKILIALALKCNTQNIIISHNHPSGNMRPSKEDDRITKQIDTACKYLGIKLLDHLIICKSSYLSYSDEGRL